MNLAVGTDLIEVERIARVLARHPRRFLTRHFTPREQAECGRDVQRLASRWAAKEAAAKALGTGIGPVGWREIEVVSAASGKPGLRLHGAARARAEAEGLIHWSVSLSDTAGHAMAVVVALGEGTGAAR